MSFCGKTVDQVLTFSAVFWKNFEELLGNLISVFYLS